MELKLPVSQEILSRIARIDRFQGAWSSQQGVPASRLARLEEAARIQSVAASCRLGGIRVSDRDVAGLLGGDAVPLRDSKEILGYAAAMTYSLPGKETVLGTETLRKLHAVLIGAEDASTVQSPWRQQQLDREAFDAEGTAAGRVFATLPPRLVVDKTEELVTWLEFELRTGDQHPVLVIGTFLLVLLAISPFDRGNGRLVRVLASLLLRRAGYEHLPYGSLEREIEELREEYYVAYDQAQTRIWTGEADPTPWLNLFLVVLDRHRERLEAKIELERKLGDYPPLQQAILRMVREHGSVDAGLLIEATGASRNTLKDNLRRLVEHGVLEKTGQRRGTRYHLATGDRPRPAMLRETRDDTRQ